MNKLQWYRGVTSYLINSIYVNVGIYPQSVLCKHSDSQVAMFCIYLSHILMIEYFIQGKESGQSSSASVIACQATHTLGVDV